MATTITTVQVAVSPSIPVPVVNQEDLPAKQAKPELSLVIKESKARERQIQEIKKRVLEPYDNIKSPVPFVVTG